MAKNQFEGKSPINKPPVKQTPSPEPVELTDEFISGRFALGDAANDDQYDRRKKMIVVEVPTETPEERLLKYDRISEYTKIALTEKNGLEKAIAKWRRDTAERFLLTSGVITTNEHGEIVLTQQGKEKLVSRGWTSWDDKNGSASSVLKWRLANIVRQKYKVTDDKEFVQLETEDILGALLNRLAKSLSPPDNLRRVASPNRKKTGFTACFFILLIFFKKIKQ